MENCAKTLNGLRRKSGAQKTGNFHIIRKLIIYTQILDIDFSCRSPDYCIVLRLILRLTQLLSEGVISEDFLPSI